MLLKGYETSLILAHKDRIRNLLLNSIRPNLISKVQAYLHGLQIGPNPVFIGVHVRRTDYLYWVQKMFKGVPVEKSYFLHAMSYFSSKFSNPVFLVISDDLSWCKDNLVATDTAGKIFFPSEKLETESEEENAALDLVTLAMANHSSEININGHSYSVVLFSVYDYGSFGFLGSLLAGGKVLVADGYSNLTHPILEALRSKQPYGWTLVDVRKIPGR